MLLLQSFKNLIQMKMKVKSLNIMKFVSMWRLDILVLAKHVHVYFHFSLHRKNHHLTRLPVDLPNQRSVMVNDINNEDAMQSALSK